MALLTRKSNIVNQNYGQTIATDPATIPNPPAGQVFEGVWNNNRWIKDEHGVIIYSSAGNIWEPYYVFSKVHDVAVTTERPAAWQRILELQYLIPPGRSVLEFKMSITYNYATTSKSAFFRFSIDDGTSWSEFVKEPKATTDELIVYYSFPADYDIVAGLGNRMIFEAAKETGSGAMVLHYADIMVERVK